MLELAKLYQNLNKMRYIVDTFTPPKGCRQASKLVE